MLHGTLTQTDDSEVLIETTADVIKPLFAYADRLGIDEFKLNVTEDGLYTRFVDPANVMIGEIELSETAFETFEADETEIGINVSNMMTALQSGRKRQTDEITLSYESQNMTTTVVRDYDGTTVQLQRNFMTIDPEDIRDMPEVPQIDYDATAEVSRLLFGDLITEINNFGDYVMFRNCDGGYDLILSENGDVGGASAVIKDCISGNGSVESIFGIDYIKNGCKAFATVGADTLHFEFGEDFPIVVSWETDTLSGMFMQAPRIRED